jgi:hypothetical protein
VVSEHIHITNLFMNDVIKNVFFLTFCGWMRIPDPQILDNEEFTECHRRPKIPTIDCH